MVEYSTNYGTLRDILNEDYYPNGMLKGCFLERECPLQMSDGIMIPKYDYSDVRSKYCNALSFYESGRLKSIYFQNRTKVKTKLGDLSAEMITYYEDGGIHRLFPLYGQINGYWSEKEETEIMEPFTGDINGIQFHHKISCFCFYPSGHIKSLTLAPNEVLSTSSPAGEIQVRIGISFYENGAIESIEPLAETEIPTQIGIIVAFNNNPVGIHGDNNSLRFGESGELLSVKTIQSGIEIIDKQNKKTHILPRQRRSFIDIEKFEMVPIEIFLKEESVEIHDSNAKTYNYSRNEYQIKSIDNYLYMPETCCADCSSCSGCHSV